MCYSADKDRETAAEERDPESEQEKLKEAIQEHGNVKQADDIGNSDDGDGDGLIRIELDNESDESDATESRVKRIT